LHTVLLVEEELDIVFRKNTQGIAEKASPE